MSFINKKTKRVVGLATAKKAGLFTSPENFLLPHGVGLDLHGKRVVSMKTLRDKLASGLLPLSKVYIQSHVYLPESKRFVMASKQTQAKQAAQVAKNAVKVNVPNLTYYATVRFYEDYEDDTRDAEENELRMMRYLGAKRFFRHTVNALR